MIAALLDASSPVAWIAASVVVPALGVLAWRAPTALLCLALILLAVRPQLLASGPLIGSGWELQQGLLTFALVANAARYGLRRVVNWPVLAVAATLILSLALGDLHPDLSPMRMLGGAGLLVLPWCFTQVVLAPGSRCLYPLLIALLPLISVAVGVIFEITGSGSLYERLEGVPRLAGATGSGSVFALLAFAAFAAALSEAARTGRPASALLAAINLALIVLSGTRMALLAALVLSATYVATAPDLRNRLLHNPALLAVGGIIVALAVVASWSLLIERSLTPTGGIRVSSRTELWTFYLDEFLKSPLFGRGIGTASIAGVGHFNLVLTTPHNVYLELLVTGGIVGFGLCLTGIALWMRHLLRGIHPGDRRFVIALLPALAVYALTENLLTYATGLTLFAYLGGLRTWSAPGRCSVALEQPATMAGRRDRGPGDRRPTVALSGVTAPGAPRSPAPSMAVKPPPLTRWLTGDGLASIIAGLALSLGAGFLSGLEESWPPIGVVRGGAWSLCYLYAIAWLWLRFGWRLAPWLLRHAPLLTVLSITVVASALWSVDPRLTLDRGLLFAGSSAVAVFIACRWDGSGIMSIFLSTYALLLLISLIAVIVFPDVAISSRDGAWQGLQADKNQLGAPAGIAILLFAAALVRGRLHALWGIGLSVLAGGILLACRSVTPLVSSGLGLTLLLTFFVATRSRLPSLVTYVLLLLGMIIAAWLALTHLRGFTEALDRDETFTNRTAVWADAIRLLRYSPWLGHGYGAVWVAGRDSWFPEFTSTTMFNTAHDGYLHLATEIGLPATALAALELAFLSYRSLQYFMMEKSTFSFFAVTYVFWFATYNLTESTLYRWNSDEWMVLVAVTVALLRPRRLASGMPILFAASRGWRAAMQAMRKREPGRPNGPRPKVDRQPEARGYAGLPDGGRHDS